MFSEWLVHLKHKEVLQSLSKGQQVTLGEDGRAEPLALKPCAVSWSQLEIKVFHKWKSSPKPSRA